MSSLFFPFLSPLKIISFKIKYVFHFSFLIPKSKGESFRSKKKKSWSPNKLVCFPFLFFKFQTFITYYLYIFLNKFCHIKFFYSYTCKDLNSPSHFFGSTNTAQLNHKIMGLSKWIYPNLIY